MIIAQHRINIVQFTLVRSHENGTVQLVAERSDFGPDLFGPVYDDAADIGFTVVNSRSGNEVTFAIDHEMEHDGEFAGYVLKPVSESLRKVPAAKNVEVVIFND